MSINQICCSFVIFLSHIICLSYCSRDFWPFRWWSLWRVCHFSSFPAQRIQFAAAQCRPKTRWPTATPSSPNTVRIIKTQEDIKSAGEPSNKICLGAAVFQTGSPWRWSEPSRSWSSPGRGRCRWGRGLRSIWRLPGNRTNAPPSDSRWPSALSALRWKEGHAKLTETSTSIFLFYI